MKIRFSIVFLLAFFLMSNVNAISTNMKENYSPLETAIVKISGNILEPITFNQIEFKRNNVRIPFMYDIKRLGEDYYLWFIVNANETGKNMTLIINDIVTSVSGLNQKIDFYQNFTINENLSDYTIKPGFVSTRDKAEFQIDSNLDESKEIEISFPYSTTLTLKPGENNIVIPTDSVSSTQILNVKIGKYIVPIYVIKNQTLVIKKNNSIIVEPDFVNLKRLKEDKNIKFNISIINAGDNKIENLYLEIDDNYFEIETDKKITLLPNQEAQYDISLKKSIDYDISQSILVKADKNNITHSILVEIEFIENRSIEVNVSDNETNFEEFLCIELDGKLCPADVTCTGTKVKSLDGSCCIGTCLLKEDDGSSSWIGYIIIGIAILVIVFAFIKYKKVKPVKNDIEKTLDSEKKEENKVP